MSTHSALTVSGHRSPDGSALASRRGERTRAGEEMLSAFRFTGAEAEAAIVGLTLAAQEEPGLFHHARTAMAKIAAASSPMLRARLAKAAANRAQPQPVEDWDTLIETVEAAIDEARELRILYSDQSGEDTIRTIRPLALAESRSGESVAAWCMLRSGFRHFRPDRIEALVALESFFKGEREALLERYMKDA